MSRKESRRISREKQIRPQFTVFCEGETEAAYIGLLKQKFRIASVAIATKVTNHNISSTFIANYKKGKPTHPKDRDYLMYDLDVEGLLAKLQAIQSATLITSNPCMELWLLLHFQDQRTPLATSQCTTRLETHLPGYQKGRIAAADWQQLEARLPEAISRAQQLQPFQNPSSLIFRLIQDLETEAGR